MTRPAKPAADPPLPGPERLFARLAGARGLVLAVSGGPDSTALMVMMAGWASRPPCLVVSIDHGLRPEAAGEARLVAANAARLGLSSRIMRAPERDGGGNLQDWARRARYRCLAQAAIEAGFDTIVTAHHLDDQAETFLMRVGRGSGVYGLAAMPEEGRAEGRAEGIRLMRPLLGIPCAALAEIVAASGLKVVDDPGNGDASFGRVRLRALLPELARQGLTPERLAATAGRLGRAAAALDHYTAALLREHFRADAFGVVSGAAEALGRAPEEVGLRALALILRAVGGADYSPRLERTENLLRAVLAAPAAGRLRRTLHGVVITLDAGTLTARREWGRDGPPAQLTQPGATVVWDRRFRIAVIDGSDLVLAPLGVSSRRLRSDAAPCEIVRTLPGLFRHDALIAAPASIAALDDGDPLGKLPAECLVGPRLGIQTRPLITI